MKISNRIANIAIKILYCMLFFIPFGISVGTTSTYLFHGGSGGKIYLPLLILTVVIIVIVVMMLMHISISVSEKMEAALCILMFCMALVLRLCAVYVLQTKPVSDFFLAHDNAVKLIHGIIDPVYINRYADFSSWGIWSLTISVIYKIFGCNYLYVQILNCILGAAATILIYVTTKRILHSRKIGILAAALFLFNPTLIMYVGVLSAEHIVIFICPILLLCLNKYLSSYVEGNVKRTLCYGLGLGVCIGLINIYRPIGIVFLIAFVISSILYRNVQAQNKKKSVLLCVAVVCIIVITNKTVSYTSEFVLKHTMKISRESTNQGYSLGRMILMGVGLDEEGNYSKYVAREFTNSYTGAPEDFSYACLKEAAYYLKTYWYKYPAVFFEKFCTAFGRPYRYPETGFTTWIYQSEESNNVGNMDVTHPFAENYLAISSTILGQYYVLVMFMNMLACVYYVCRKCNYEMFFLSLFCFGFTLILVLGEANGRYKSVLFPYLSILAAVGIWNACRFGTEVFSRYIKRK